MWLTIFGLLLLTAPFLLIFNDRDRIGAFVRILLFLFVAHTFIAVLTQWLKGFSYPVIFSIHCIIAVLVFLKLQFKNIFAEVHQFWKKVDWILLATLAIIFVHLYAVHYNYSGPVTTVVNPHVDKHVENMVYPYPYFADEWVAVSLIQNIYATQSLPFSNPLMLAAEPFLNFEFIFHSFIAELLMLLNLVPLVDYTKLAVAFGMLVCLLLYLILRSDGVSRLTASLTSMAALYITNGVNLPGLWYLIPMTTGLIPLLISFFYMNRLQAKWIFVSAGVALLFYPPFFPFLAVGILMTILTHPRFSKAEKFQSLGKFAGIVAVSAIVISSAYYMTKGFKGGELFQIVLGWFWYKPFISEGMLKFAIWDVVPVIVLVLAGVGVWRIFQQKPWLSMMIFLGLIYWLVYAWFPVRIIIGYERIVVVTSLMLVLVSGYGIEYFVSRLVGKTRNSQKWLVPTLQILTLIAFCLLAFTYTDRPHWEKLTVVNKESSKAYRPAAPANQYLHEDDLALFRHISGKRFLSLPWKGAVIGVATGNFPLSMKAGTISRHRKMFYQFMQGDCKEKYSLAHSNYLDYVYALKFHCPEFNPVGVSQEGLILYKFR